MAPAENFHLAREVFEETYASLRCQTPSKCSPAYRMPAELLQGIHEDLLHRAEREATLPGFRKVMIAGGRKHYSRTSPDALDVCALSDLRLGCANIGKRLDLIIRSPSCYTSALHFLAEDENAWLLPVSVYHVSSTVQQLFVEGARFSVKEPWLKESSNGYFIRIDTVADVQLWPLRSLISSPAEHQSTGPYHLSEIRKLREEGSQSFVQGNTRRAIKSYESGLSSARIHAAGVEPNDAPTLGTEMALLSLNLAAAYLKVGLPGRALLHLSILGKPSLPYVFTQEQQKKIVHRTASAWRRLGRWRDLHEYLRSTEVANIVEQEEVLQDTLSCAKNTVEKAHIGMYDWLGLYKRAAANGVVQVAEYQGTVKVTNIPGKGKGVIALEDLQEGCLLMVANPLAYSRVSQEATRLNLGVNLSSNSIDSPAQLDLVSQLLELVATDVPGTTECLSGLYAGPAISHERVDGSAYSPDKLRDVCDAGNIEGICTYNSFRPRCITKSFDTEVETEHSEVHSRSALYHLPSMINHSCLGNASFVFYDTVLVVRASTRIAVGQEITFSYCDPTAEFEDRQLHLQRYGFTCICPLCVSDKIRGSDSRASVSRAMASNFHKASHSSASMEALIKLICGASPQSSVPNYALYRCYRALSSCYQKEGRKFKSILASEIEALQALGAVLQPFALSMIPEIPMASSLFERKPLFAVQDAIISCLKIAFDHLEKSDLLHAQKWYAEAGNLHELEFGPDIFLLRMGVFIAAQGWEKLLDL